MDLFSKITSFHLDALKEVGNIGAGHAATALSQLLNKKVDMSVPSVRIMSFNEMMQLVGGPEEIIASVFCRIQGGAPGTIYFIMPVKDASVLLQRLMGDPTITLEQEEASELAMSALQEVGNIVAGSYLSSFSDFTQLRLTPSTPASSIDMAGAILSFGLNELARYTDMAIVIDTRFSEIDEEVSNHINGYFFLLPDPSAFETIFQSLGVALDE